MYTLSKYYKLAALLPLALTAVSGIILSVTHDGSNYKSEWSTDDGFVLTVFLIILFSFIVAMLSLTIFLNNRLAIRNNTFFSFLSWIVLAGSACVFVIYQEVLNFTGYSDIDGVYEGNRLLDGYIMSVAIIHIAGLITTFLHFNASYESIKEKRS